MPAGDWARAGRISSQRFNNAMTAVAVNSVDPNKLIQESMKARSREKQMAMKAKSVLKRTEKDIEVFEARNDAEMTIGKAKMDMKKTQRKAGLLAAGAAMIGGSIMDAKRDKTPPPTFQSDLTGLEAIIQKKEGSLQQKMEDLREFREKGPDKVTVPSFNEDGTLNLSGSTLGEQTAGTIKSTDPTASTASTLTSSNNSSFFNTSKLTDKDFSELAYVVSGEAARGTDDEFGVAASVLNRVQSSQYPNTIAGVARQPKQYEAVTIGTARYDSGLAARLKENVGRINSALDTLQGRTDFKGQTMLSNRVSSEDPMFDPKGNFYHYNYQ